MDAVRFSIAAVAAILFVARPDVRTAGTPRAREIADRAVAYVKWYDQQLPAVVCDELYEQTGDEHTGTRLSDRDERTLRSVIAWVHLPTRADTIAVREVTETDGRIVQESSRIRQLLESPAEQLETQIRTLLDESAAHNLAPGSRNINLPTFPLVYLRPPYADRGRWRTAGRDGTRILLDYEERGRPTAVRSESGDNLQGRGRFWVDERSGRIERVEFRLAGRKAVVAGPRERAWTDISYHGDVTFSPDVRLGLWLPASMTDEYVRFSGKYRLSVEGRASYSNYRRFETAGRVIGIHP